MNKFFETNNHFSDTEILDTKEILDTVIQSINEKISKGTRVLNTMNDNDKKVIAKIKEICKDGKRRGFKVTSYECDYVHFIIRDDGVILERRAGNKPLYEALALAIAFDLRDVAKDLITNVLIPIGHPEDLVDLQVDWQWRTHMLWYPDTIPSVLSKAIAKRLLETFPPLNEHGDIRVISKTLSKLLDELKAEGY
jgi:hypothetical protein